MGKRKRFVVRPVYVDDGPDYLLVFDKLAPKTQDFIPVPNRIYSFKGNLDRTLYRIIGQEWELAQPYFADLEEVEGYIPVAIAV